MVTLTKPKSGFSFVLSLLTVFCGGVAFGDLDLGTLIPLDDSVQIQSSRVAYDRRTGEFSCTVKTTNTSAEAISAPIYMVIESITSSAVTVANADGYTADGKPYFVILQDGELVSGDNISTRVAFANPQRRRFNFVARAYCQAPVEISLEQSLSFMNVKKNAPPEYVAFSVKLTGTAGNTYNVTFEQTISPDTGGLSLSSDYPGNWSTSVDSTWTVNESVIGLDLGTYIITTTATILETGGSASSELVVNVFVGII